MPAPLSIMDLHWLAATFAQAGEPESALAFLKQPASEQPVRKRVEPSGGRIPGEQPVKPGVASR
ncbi:MAG: hypothetical protein HQL95_02990 [Magnetococcales bacterium]|nr:hypothetical protein [Magnetococcales bacterium]